MAKLSKAQQDYSMSRVRDIVASKYPIPTQPTPPNVKAHVQKLLGRKLPDEAFNSGYRHYWSDVENFLLEYDPAFDDYRKECAFVEEEQSRIKDERERAVKAAEDQIMLGEAEEVMQYLRVLEEMPVVEVKKVAKKKVAKKKTQKKA